jgi:hypothetical protein
MTKMSLQTVIGAMKEKCQKKKKEKEKRKMPGN